MHVNFVLSQCSQKLYLLKLLRSQGLSTAQLDQVSQAIIVSRLQWLRFLILSGKIQWFVAV